jgi:hypothetical protein
VERYLEGLLEKGEERKRLTEQLMVLTSETLETIAEYAELEDCVSVAGTEYHVMEIDSNIGTWRTVVAVDGDGYLYVFNDRVAPGANFYLHGDFQAELQNAYRELWLRTANHLPEIAMAFEVEAAKAAADMRTIFEKLKTWCDSVGDTRG